jgi:hypothetical protein
MKRTPRLVLFLAAVVLAGCASGPVTDSTDLEGPVSGRKDETKVVVASDGSPVGLGDLARIVKTVRKYKNLGASEQEILRRVASLKLDGLVATQMQRLEPQFAKKKADVRRKTQAKIATVRRQGTTAGKPAAVVENEVAAVQAEEVVEIRQIDLDWKAAARAEVAKSYGSDFALPVQNAEGKAVVAFASLRESGVSVSAAAYELTGTSNQLATAAAQGGREVSHEGKSYALLDAQVVLR